jgi:hypothetical protein
VQLNLSAGSAAAGWRPELGLLPVPGPLPMLFSSCVLPLTVPVQGKFMASRGVGDGTRAGTPIRAWFSVSASALDCWIAMMRACVRASGLPLRRHWRCVHCCINLHPTHAEMCLCVVVCFTT